MLISTGPPLFPERRAIPPAMNSRQQADLYQAVTTPFGKRWNRADRSGDGSGRSGDWFRPASGTASRLASSPAAIRSLERRRKRLEERLQQEKLNRQTDPDVTFPDPSPSPVFDPDELEDAPSEGRRRRLRN